MTGVDNNKINKLTYLEAYLLLPPEKQVTNKNNLFELLKTDNF